MTKEKYAFELKGWNFSVCSRDELTFNRPSDTSHIYGNALADTESSNLWPETKSVVSFVLRSLMQRVESLQKRIA
jgi:hypothetical protein